MKFWNIWYSYKKEFSNACLICGFHAAAESYGRNEVKKME
jgi:hypothetical protein